MIKQKLRGGRFMSQSNMSYHRLSLGRISKRIFPNFIDLLSGWAMGKGEGRGGRGVEGRGGREK